MRSARTGRTLSSRTKISLGTILTDGLLERVAGVTGTPHDLEGELLIMPQSALKVQVGRIRDMAEILGKINESVNRNEAVYLLRVLVARLSQYALREYLSAKPAV